MGCWEHHLPFPGPIRALLLATEIQALLQSLPGQERSHPLQKQLKSSVCFTGSSISPSEAWMGPIIGGHKRQEHADRQLGTVSVPSPQPSSHLTASPDLQGSVLRELALEVSQGLHDS